MKKITSYFVAVLILVALPMAALAAVSAPPKEGLFEFTLGGYIKMETDWDSTQTNKNLTAPIQRNNDPNFQHGRLKMTANSTRFSFNFKGPKIFGAQVTGLIEADFDAGGNAVVPGADTLGFGNFRLRHAMFRLNWPETELLLGQFWGYFSEFTPETAQDSGCQFVGSPTQRLAQIRLTQKFLGQYTVSFLIGAPFNTAQDNALNAPLFIAGNPAPGESSEYPQLQAKFAFEADLWGKAAFYGAPRGFAAQVAAGWQRTRYRSGVFAPGSVVTFGNGQLAFPVGTAQPDQQYLNSWIVMGSLFIPVLSTSSANLAGTASISTQWYVGQGVNAFGEGIDGNSTFLSYQSTGFFAGGFFDLYDREMMKQFGGFVQAQYYFTNQWFVNLVYGFSKVYDVDFGSNPVLTVTQFPFNPRGSTYLAPGDQFKMWQQANVTLWYRPITSLKFGLQYSYQRTDWLQALDGARTATPVAPGPLNGGDAGDNHRVMFAGFFYF